MRYDLFHAKALHAALIEELGKDYGVPGERQIRRWVNGETPVPNRYRRVIDELLGIDTEKAPPPRWAEELAVDTARTVVLQLIAALRTPGEAADILRRFRELARSLPPSGAGSPRVDDEQSDQAKGTRRGQGT